MSSGQEEYAVRDPIASPDASCKADVLVRVMETVMRMTLKVSDASAARLLLPENNGFRTRARAWLRGDAVEFAEVGDIAAMGLEPGGRAEGPSSAYCVPMYRGSRLAAILYLEHEHAENIFTDCVRSLLDQLAPQIAIVLEDATAQSAPRHDGTAPLLAPSHLQQVRVDLAHASTVSAIDALVSSVTHEISQPLSAIDASSSAGLRWLQRATPNLDEAVISLEKVRSCAIRARKIVDDLRSLKSQPGIPGGTFDIHGAMRDVVQLLRVRIEEQRVTVTFSGMDGPQPVTGDRVQIQQVIENLLVNALEAMADVSGRARTLHLSSAAGDDSTVVISIADSGPGVTPDQEEKLFLPFVTTKSRGMGMGLPICRRIIEAHGGMMWIDAVTPCGLRVSFTLEKGRA